MSVESAILNYPQHWELTTLGLLCANGGGDIQTGPFGSQLHASDYVEEGIPSIMPKNISVEGISTEDIAYISKEDAGRLSKYRVKAGDIVYSRRGDVEKCALVTDKEEGWLCGTGCLRIRLGNSAKVSSVYLHAYLAHPSIREWIVRHAIGATMPNLNTGILSSIPVLIPPDEERSVVEGIWHGINKKIILNRQTNQTLEQIAQAIFKSWFVDFDPVRAKIAAREAFIQQHPEVTLEAIRAATGTEGDTPAHAAAKACELAAICAISGMTEEQLAELDDAQGSANVAGGRKPGAIAEVLQQLKATASLFPDSLVESELGEVPEGWCWSEIGNEVKVVGGGTPSTKNTEFWEGGHIHWTTPRDMSNLTDKILIDTERRITDKGLARISSGLLPVNTVLMSSRAPVGYLAISKIPVAINQGYIAMKCEGILSPEYVVQWAESVMDDIKQRSSGTTFAEISKKNFRVIPVVMPTKSIIDVYTKQVSRMYLKITESLVETRHLKDTRDTLLPRLLSGEYNLVS